MKLHSRPVLFVSAFITTWAGLAHGQAGETPQAAKPLWEVGVGGIGVHGPDYPAAATGKARAALVPIVIYRGSRLRLDDSGVRGRLFYTGRFELDVSGAAAFNGRNSAARAGMPEIDYTFELGTQARWRMPLEGGRQFSAHLKARSVFSTDWRSFKQRGWVLEPELRWQVNGWPDAASQVQFGALATWATEPLHDYFYQVDPAYATASRPAYDARAGYFGSAVRAFWSRRLNPSTTVSLGVTLNHHGGAANAASPLFERRSTASALAAVIWTPWRSGEMAAP